MAQDAPDQAVTSTSVPSTTSILPVLKMLQPDTSSQLGEAIKRKVTAGKPLLERLGMRQLSLLEHLGMLIKKGRALETCDSTEMMMMTPLKVVSKQAQNYDDIHDPHYAWNWGTHGGGPPWGSQTNLSNKQKTQMLKAVYNFNPKNAIYSLNAQGDCPPF